MFKGERGQAGGLTKRTLVLLVLMVIVVIVVIFAVLRLDLHEFFKNLPDFSRGKKSPTDLLVDAVVYGKNVKVLLNDGYGRCVVAETEKYDSWLRKYGVKKWKLYKNTGSDKTPNWIEYDPRAYGIDRITSDMIEGSLTVFDPLPIPFRQIIKQDLIEACYLDEGDFKETEILGKKVRLLLADEDGKCIIYESKQDPTLEHYALKKVLFGEDKLFYLDNGRWQEVDYLSEEKLKELQIAIKLIEKEKEVKEYLNNYDVKFCGSCEPRGLCSSYIDLLKGLGNRDVYNEGVGEGICKGSYKQYYVFEKGKIYNEKFLKDIIEDYIDEMNAKDGNFYVFRYCTNKEEDPKEDVCYLAHKPSGDSLYGVREGDFYIFNKGSNEWKKSDVVVHSESELGELSDRKKIKNALIKEC